MAAVSGSIVAILDMPEGQPLTLLRFRQYPYISIRSGTVPPVCMCNLHSLSSKYTHGADNYIIEISNTLKRFQPLLATLNAGSSALLLLKAAFSPFVTWFFFVTVSHRRLLWGHPAVFFDQILLSPCRSVKNPCLSIAE